MKKDVIYHLSRFRDIYGPLNDQKYDSTMFEKYTDKLSKLSVFFFGTRALAYILDEMRYFMPSWHKCASVEATGVARRRTASYRQSSSTGSSNLEF